MKKVFIFIFIYTIFLSFSKAEVIKNIQIEGNKRVSKETIKIYGDIKLNKNYSEIDLNDILNNLYSTNFFEDVSVQTANRVLKVTVKEYEVIDNIIILGETSNKYKEQIKKIINSKEKGSFIKNNLARDAEIIKRLYSTAGYNFTNVTTKVREIDGETIDLVLDIDKGNVTKISKISFSGDKKVKEKRLRDVIASEESKFWKIISNNTKFNQSLVDLDVRLLKNYYKSIGYYDVNINSNSAELNQSGNVRLTYTIDAGKRYIFKKISTVVDPTFDKNLFFELNDEYQKVIGNYYSPFKIKKLLETIDEIIEKHNLQFVEHNVEEILGDGTIEIKFNIFEGDKVLVERINVLGNNVTRESVIRNQFELDEGDPYNEILKNKSISNMKSLNFFKSVKTLILC